jgi:HEAT repeat protein
MSPSPLSRRAYALPLLGAVLFAPAARAQATAAAESAAVTTLIQSVRGANPLLCELASRTIEQGWGWGGRAYDPRAVREPVLRAVIAVIHEHPPRPTSVTELAAALGDDDACVRRIAAPLLGRIEHPTARAALRTALRDARPATREAAAFGLGFTDDAAMIPALLGGIQDAVPRVRAVSAWALGEIEDARAIGALIRLLREDTDPEVRAAAAAAIGEIEG